MVFQFRNKCCIFATEMKKYIHILMSVLLSMTVLLMGPGFNVVRCMHSGDVRAVTCLDKSNMGCSPTSDCMSVEHVQLSPSNAAHSIVYDFNAVQPLIAIIPSVVAEWLFSIQIKPIVRIFDLVRGGPPREYLSFIRVLRI